MSLPTTISTKIAKLIPMLGSDRDGEVLGAVHAIKRTLRSAGADLHDLARRLSFDPPRPEPRTYEPPRPPPGPARWRRLSPRDRIIYLDGIKALALSPWEREFVRSIDARLRACPYATFSQRQDAIIDGLLRRCWEEEQHD